MVSSLVKRDLKKILECFCLLAYLYNALFSSLCPWVFVAQSCLTLCDPMDCSPPGYREPTRLFCPFFSRQEYWSGLLFPSTGDLSDPGIELWSPALQGDSFPSEPPGKPSPSPYTWSNLCSLWVFPLGGPALQTNNSTSSNLVLFYFLR